MTYILVFKIVYWDHEMKILFGDSEVCVM